MHAVPQDRESAGQQVREAGRDWYGRIRGSDGIFSFHPFDPNSISGNGYPAPVRMRDELVSSGVIERYDALRSTTGCGMPRCRTWLNS